MTLPEAKGLIDLDTVLVRISWRVFSCSSKSIFSLFWLALSHRPPPVSDNSVVLSQMTRIILPAPLFWLCWCPSLSWCLCLLLAPLVSFPSLVYDCISHPSYLLDQVSLPWMYPIRTCSLPVSGGHWLWFLSVPALLCAQHLCYLMTVTACARGLGLGIYRRAVPRGTNIHCPKMFKFWFLSRVA